MTNPDVQRRIATKLLIISELVLLVTVLVLIMPVWRAMHRQVVENLQNELKAIASTAALEIDGDLHDQIRVAQDADTEAFRTMRDHLRAVQKANHVQYDHIYTFFRDPDEGIVRFGVMLHDTPFVGDPYELRPEMLPVFDDGAMAATELYEDEHGKWISAYAPIRNSAGHVVGLLEVDKDSTAYLQEFHGYRRLTISVAVLALGISSLLGWFVLQRLVIRPLAAVHSGMRALSNQDFTHEVRLRTGDEFEALAHTFNGLSKQLNLASTIQSGFFPTTMPAFPGYRIAGDSIPCDATGGDYFDAFPLEDGRLAVLIADVSGHGIGPSLLMATCRSALRALSMTGLAPDDLVDRLNCHLLEDLTSGRFITMLYGIIDADGRFVFTNAGHGPALVLQGDVVTHLVTHRPPLGIDVPLDDEEVATTIDLQIGDRLLLTSDGLSEAMNANGDAFGVEPIEAALADRSLDATGVVQRLRQELHQHCGGPSRTDDVTILCVERTGVTAGAAGCTHHANDGLTQWVQSADPTGRPIDRVVARRIEGVRIHAQLLEHHEVQQAGGRHPFVRPACLRRHGTLQPLCHESGETGRPAVPAVPSVADDFTIERCVGANRACRTLVLVRERAVFEVRIRPEDDVVVHRPLPHDVERHRRREVEQLMVEEWREDRDIGKQAVRGQSDLASRSIEGRELAKRIRAFRIPAQFLFDDRTRAFPIVRSFVRVTQHIRHETDVTSEEFLGHDARLAGFERLHPTLAEDARWIVHITGNPVVRVPRVGTEMISQPEDPAVLVGAEMLTQILPVLTLEIRRRANDAMRNPHGRAQVRRGLDLDALLRRVILAGDGKLRRTTLPTEFKQNVTRVASAGDRHRHLFRISLATRNGVREQLSDSLHGLLVRGILWQTDRCAIVYVERAVPGDSAIRWSHAHGSKRRQVTQIETQVQKTPSAATSMSLGAPCRMTSTRDGETMTVSSNAA